MTRSAAGLVKDGLAGTERPRRHRAGPSGPEWGGIIGAMSEREGSGSRAAGGNGPIACPFVAYEDERDERSDRPDHRHRCYAEVRPAPRASAHQEAYCLSAAFATCPTFQDWARREAARARSPRPDEAASAAAAGFGAAAASAAAAGVPAVPAPDVTAPPVSAPEGPGTEREVEVGEPAVEWIPTERDDSRPDPRIDDQGVPPARTRRRDWAAPPPWVGGVPPGGRGPGPTRGGGEASTPGFLGGRERGDSPPVDPELAGLAGSRWLRDLPEGPAVVPAEAELGPDAGRTGPPRSRAVERPAARRPGSGIPRDVAHPAWERPSRHEAYPAIRRRMRLPSAGRLGIGVAALAVAALVLFALPFILKALGGGESGAGPIATPSRPPASSGAPTPTPQPTAQIYVVVQGDNILKIAQSFGLTQAELLAANPQIKDPNKIAIGDQITIPIPPPSVIVNASPSPIVGASASP